MEQPDIHDSNQEALIKAQSLKDLTVEKGKLVEVASGWGKITRWFRNIQGAVDKQVVKIAHETLVAQKDKIRADIDKGMKEAQVQDALPLDDKLKIPAEFRKLLLKHVKPLTSAVVATRMNYLFAESQKNLEQLNQLGNKFFVSPEQRNQTALSHLPQDVALTYRFNSSPEEFIDRYVVLGKDKVQLETSVDLFGAIINTTDSAIKNKLIDEFVMKTLTITEESAFLENLRSKLLKIKQNPDKNLLNSLKLDQGEMSRLLRTNMVEHHEYKQTLMTHLSDLRLSPDIRHLESLAKLCKENLPKDLRKEVLLTMNSVEFQHLLNDLHKNFMIRTDGFIEKIGLMNITITPDEFDDLTDYLKTTAIYWRAGTFAGDEVKEKIEVQKNKLQEFIAKLSPENKAQLVKEMSKPIHEGQFSAIIRAERSGLEE